MSSTHIAYIHCDVCNRTARHDNEDASTTRLRYALRLAGWRYVGGMDYCPRCESQDT